MNEKTSNSPKKPWPKNRDDAKDAVDAFSAALTRAGWDKDFRQRLKTSPETNPKEARDRVSDEGQIEIPEDILVLFHEPEDCKNIYPFFLPKPDGDLEPYYRYFQGCLPKFQLSDIPPAGSDGKKAREAKAGAPGAAGGKKDWTFPNIADAFTAVLKRSQTDPAFRERLLVSLASAKKALEEEGNISVPAEAIILFHEDESNEKYHMFALPPLDETAKKEYKYRLQFEGFYFVW